MATQMGSEVMNVGPKSFMGRGKEPMTRKPHMLRRCLAIAASLLGVMPASLPWRHVDKGVRLRERIYALHDGKESHPTRRRQGVEVRDRVARPKLVGGLAPQPLGRV